MPSWRNMPSMPKVRASSGMIGTIRSPSSLSLISCARMRTKAMVVEISRSPEPSRMAFRVSSGGVGMLKLLTRRCGTKPPRAARRLARYLASALPSSGRKNGRFSSSSSLTGMSKRSRNFFRLSTSTFFTLCAMFFASPLPVP
ncbi:hypothetical protein D3C84_587970 [compost metagenome]